jgi:anthranilate/para-aminobenzoate synthase component I
MARVIRRVPLPPDPIALARALEGRDGLAVLASSPESAMREGDGRFSFVACDPVETSCDLVPPAGPAEPGWAGFGAAPRWVGFVPYEATRALERRARETRPAPRISAPRWKRYDAVARVDHVTGEVAVEADSAAACDRLFGALRRPARVPGSAVLRSRDGEPPRRHAERVGAALDYIGRGDVYQVNLARRLDFGFEGAPLDLFATLFAKTPSPFGVHWDVDGDHFVTGTSPELAREARGDALRTAPIKGTRPRGACAEGDEAERRDLESSEKERAELVMAVDLHRNDLGRVARSGSVRVLGEPRTLRSRTVFSRAHEIVARRELASDLSSVVSAVLPCGSVTGAPKVRAMEIIAELEAHRRGLYTGAVGYVGRDGALVLAMAIRTAVVSRRDGALEYFTGGGIVAGSDPRRELEETEWKARQLTGA